MSFITEKPVEKVFFDGRYYKVNPAFDTVFNITKLYKEDILTPQDKIDTALRMLGLSRARIFLCPSEKRAKLLEEIYMQCINTKERPITKKSPVPVLDFEEDAEYIYASFLSDYGIDLVDMQGRLSFRKFVYLFQGLSEKTKIKEVMRIRSMDVPEPTKYNQKYIQSILELKSFYALPVKGGGGKNGLDHLFTTLENLERK